MLMVLQEQKGSTRVRSCQSCLCVSFFSVPLPSSYTHFSVFHVKSVMCPWLLPSVFRAHHVAVSLSFPVLSLGLCLLFPVLFWSSFLVIMFSFASVFASPVSLCPILCPPFPDVFCHSVCALALVSPGFSGPSFLVFTDGSCSHWTELELDIFKWKDMPIPLKSFF